MKTIRSIEHVTEVMEVEPVLVVPKPHGRTAFCEREEMLKAAQTEGKELWELAIDYEMSRAGWTYDQVWEYMEYVVETMEHSSKEALKRRHRYGRNY